MLGKNNNLTNKRIEWIDLLKGWAILWMIIGHIIGGLYAASFTSKYAIYLRRFAYAFHMPLMFICSGYLTAGSDLREKYKDFRHYFFDLLVKLYIPYLIFIYLSWGIKYFIYSGNGDVSFNELWKNLYSGRFSTWFLLALMMMQIIQGIIVFCKLPNILNLFIWFTIFAVAICGVVFKFSLPSVIGWLSFGVYYYLGMVLRKRKILDKKVKLQVVVAMLMVIVGITLPGEVNCIYKKFFTGIGMTLLFIHFVDRLKIRSSILSRMGKDSMVFYLSSTLLTPLMRVILLKCGCNDFTLQWTLGTVLTVGIIMLEIVLYRNVSWLHWVEYVFYPQKLFQKRKKIGNGMFPEYQTKRQ